MTNNAHKTSIRPNVANATSPTRVIVVYIPCPDPSLSRNMDINGTFVQIFVPETEPVPGLSYVGWTYKVTSFRMKKSSRQR